MAKELKARIPDLNELELRLKDLGASFVRELNVLDTYFCQPKGLVLKVVKDNDGVHLSRLEAVDGRFKMVECRELEQLPSLEEELRAAHGIHRVLKKRRRLYEFGALTIDLNLIEDVGDFIILAGENPREEDMIEVLGVEKPEYITVPFSEL